MSKTPVPLIYACREAGVSYWVGYRAVSSGQVPATRCGRFWLVSPADLVKFAAA